MRLSLPACSSSVMPCRSTCTLSSTLARSLLYCGQTHQHTHILLYITHILKEGRDSGAESAPSTIHLPQFCWGRSWCWTWSPAAERDTGRCSHSSPCETKAARWDSALTETWALRPACAVSYLYMLPNVNSMFGFWNSIPGRKFLFSGWTMNGVSII